METHFTHSPQPVTFERTIGILAYITLIGWIIALVMNSSKQGEEKRYNAFHIRQMLGLYIFSFVLSIAVFILVFVAPILALILNLLYLGMLVLWIFGLINAINGLRKPVPLTGEPTEKIFGSAFE